jgi:hypothetical protein
MLILSSWKDDVIRPDFSTHGASLWLDYYFPSPLYYNILEALISDIPANDTALVNDPSLQNGSAQFHQTLLFIKRRRRRLAANAFNRWRSQCGWKASPWTSLLSMTSLSSDDYCTLSRDKEGDDYRNNGDNDSPNDDNDDDDDDSGHSNSDDSALGQFTLRGANRFTYGSASRQHDITSSWVEVPHYHLDQISKSSPPTDAVRCHWKRASGALVLWEEDVFSPNKLPKDGRVEWDENVFGPDAENVTE